MKRISVFIIVTLMVIGYASITTTINIYGNSKLVENISDFKVYLKNVVMNEEEIEVTNNDTFEIDTLNGDITYEIVNDSIEYDAEVYLECNGTSEEETEWSYDYTGSEQTFTVPNTGTYKLETWGAQGGSASSTYVGGYGGYSVGQINLTKEENLYINVGGTGTYETGGYIGVTGQTINFTNGYGHGYGTGGTQTEGGSAVWISDAVSLDYTWFLDGIFGSAGKKVSNGGPQSAGGGGFYGGGSGDHGGGGGGSGYIGNSLLTEKNMYCYNCTESSEEATKTISTTCANATPTENCSKIGNGYARITLLEANNIYTTDKEIIEAQDSILSTLENLDYENLTCKLKVSKISKSIIEDEYTGPTSWDFDYTGSEHEFIAPITGTYKLETWGAQGGSDSILSLNYGGYSQGLIEITKGQILYLNIGGHGNEYSNTILSNGGYNGGGYGGVTSGTILQMQGGSGSGGATHIATFSGLLSTLNNNRNSILIVSGGGGGGCISQSGGSGGGISGVDGTSISSYPIYYGKAGNQIIGGYNVSTGSNYASFGKGSDLEENGYGGNGSGGGFYGGAGTDRIHSGAGGGSGYIGNSLLTDKSMYCYNCTESNEESTKTISTTCANETPTENCSKIGNGYARITLIT